MTHAFVIFAYDGNAHMVPKCAEAIMRQSPGSFIYVASETKNAHYAAPVGLFPTTFNRNGNLNGRSAIIGILETLKAVSSFTRAQFVWKVDPDTLLCSRALLQGAENSDIAGFQCPDHREGVVNPSNVLLGCFYGIRSSSIHLLIRSLSNQSIEQFAPEDVVITTEAFILGMRRFALPVNQSLPDALHFWRWDAPLSLEKYRYCAAINFGNPGITVNGFHDLADGVLRFPFSLPLPIFKDHPNACANNERSVCAVCRIASKGDWRKSQTGSTDFPCPRGRPMVKDPVGSVHAKRTASDIRLSRSPVTIAKAVSLLKTVFTTQEESLEIRQYRRQACGACDYIRYDTQGWWCGVESGCGCGIGGMVVNAWLTIESADLTRYKESKGKLLCQHPDRANGKGWQPLPLETP